MAATTSRSEAPVPPRHRRVLTSAEQAAPQLGGPLGERIPGVDVARALAIIGMIAVHTGPTNGTDLAGRVYASPFGRASLLFVLVAGVGITLLARSRRASLRSARVTLLWRAALLLPAGLALQRLDHGANVILQAYAVLFVVAVFTLALSSRWLVSLAAVVSTVGPLAYWWGQSNAPHVYDRKNGALSESVPDILHALVLSGPYPLVTWAGPLLLGMWLGRQDLSQGWLHRRLIVVGASIAVAAVVVAELLTTIGGAAVEDPRDPWHLVIAVPHSQMPLWLIGGTASAVAVLGLALWATGGEGRWYRPLVATGQLALTVYVGHLVSLHLAPDALRSGDVGTAVTIVAVSVAMIVGLAAAWRARLRRGPLERLLQPPRRLISPPQ